jgi:prefoldin beta subunit
MSFMESAPNMSPQQQQDVAKLQQMQQNLEMAMQQRYTMEAQLKEVEFALSELEKEKTNENAEIYTVAGMLFIKKPLEEVLSSTKDRQATLEVRVKSLISRENQMKAQFTEYRDKLQTSLTQTK